MLKLAPRSGVSGAVVMPRRVALVATLSSLVLWLAIQMPAAAAGQAPKSKASGAVTAPLDVIARDGKRHRFNVELALTEADRSVGLMYRWALAEDGGMLFVFDQDRHVSMWMRNTFIPLTMLFVKPDGTIARIIDRATPLSEESIHSGAPVRAVVELPGGTAARLDLRPGDRIESVAFKARTPGS